LNEKGALVNRFGIPSLGIGVGLRTAHYAYILEQRPELGFFEILSENYLETAGRPLLFLDRIAELYPVVMHGVSLSIGSTAPLDFAYLRQLKALRKRTGARWISDHLCWTGTAHKNTHDLLPLPYTEGALAHTIERVRVVQDFLEAPLALENPSSYAEFAASTLSEAEFLARLSDQADCALLLDVNNVYVSAHNHGFDAKQYIHSLPADRVVQFHVAGHTHAGSHIVDTHIGPVVEPVWELLRLAAAHTGCGSALLEWDAEIPEFELVLREARLAEPLLGPRVAA